jgi:RNA polymerase sigma-70 factor (ECF subfamily)
MTNSLNENRDTELTQLLLRVAGADQAAFNRLYTSASPAIYGVLMRMFDNSAAAEDALQEAFVRIWQKAATYDSSQGKPLTWMTSIARYHALDVLRSQSSRVSRDQNFATEAERARDTLQGLQDQVDDSQLLSICLERLEPEARDCVVHAYCGGYSHQELCDLTGRALGTIKSWIRRSLNSLRECVDELA